MVWATFSVLAAEWLTRGANDKEIDIMTAEVTPANFAGIDFGDVVINHPRSRVVEPIRRASDWIIVDGGYNPEVAPLERSGCSARSAV